MRRFTIDGRTVSSFADFVAAVNAGFIVHFDDTWHGNLDAFNDYLSWPKEQEYEFEVLGAEICASHLGHAAQAEWLRGILETCHHSNIHDVRRRLRKAELGEGETLFEIILEIISRNPHVRLVLR